VLGVGCLGVGCRLLGVGCWVLGVGCWVLGVGCWVLGVGCWVSSVGCWVLGVGCRVLGVGWFGSWVFGVLGVWGCCLVGKGEKEKAGSGWTQKANEFTMEFFLMGDPQPTKTVSTYGLTKFQSEMICRVDWCSHPIGSFLFLSLSLSLSSYSISRLKGTSSF